MSDWEADLRRIARAGPDERAFDPRAACAGGIAEIDRLRAQLALLCAAGRDLTVAVNDPRAWGPGGGIQDRVTWFQAALDEIADTPRGVTSAEG